MMIDDGDWLVMLWMIDDDDGDDADWMIDDDEWLMLMMPCSPFGHRVPVQCYMGADVDAITFGFHFSGFRVLLLSL